MYVPQVFGDRFPSSNSRSSTSKCYPLLLRSLSAYDYLSHLPVLSNNGKSCGNPVLFYGAESNLPGLLVIETWAFVVLGILLLYPVYYTVFYLGQMIG